MTSCLPADQPLIVSACYKSNCFKLGYVPRDSGNFDVELGSPFYIGKTYTINVQSKDGYLAAESSSFTVEETCDCTPSIVITSKLESCYGAKDV